MLFFIKHDNDRKLLVSICIEKLVSAKSKTQDIEQVKIAF